MYVVGIIILILQVKTLLNNLFKTTTLTNGRAEIWIQVYKS